MLKADGYGWGAATLARSIDDLVDGYCVDDLEELTELRADTARPIVLLADLDAPLVATALDANAVPTLSSLEAFDAAAAWATRHGRRARVRLGVRSAAAWSGVAPGEVAALAPHLASLPLDVEVWTHLTEPAFAAEQRAALNDAVARLHASGVTVAGVDADGTASAARGPSAHATSVRVGIGLFGARCGGAVDVRSALTAHAAVARVVPARGQLAGYGDVRAPESGTLLVARCGYADGFPRVAPFAGILAVGMRYAVVHRDGPAASVALVDASTDLDAFAAAARAAPHEVVVRLGLAQAGSRLNPSAS